MIYPLNSFLCLCLPRLLPSLPLALVLYLSRVVPSTLNGGNVKPFETFIKSPECASVLDGFINQDNQSALQVSLVPAVEVALADEGKLIKYLMFAYE